MRKILVFLEDVIANDGLLKEVLLLQLQLLLVPHEEEEQLCLEGGSGFVAVEVLQERVVQVFVDAGGAEMGSEKLHERRLADADGSFNRDVVKVHSRFSL